MKRDLFDELTKWRDYALRKPLIVRGARQVGKSWLINTFGKSFKYYIEINFEKDKKAHELFSDTINIQEIIKNLGYYKGIPIEPHKTLVFLDEIQECPNALRALRYFKEEFPELHIIAAGSLLEFAIEQYGLAVGRLQFLHLYPLSFGEFLNATGKQPLRKSLLQGDFPEVMHEELLKEIKHYSIIGGMPEVVSTWLKFDDLKLCQDMQDTIINTYRQDFEKYAKKQQIDYVATLFNKIPKQLGNKFVYAKIDAGISLHNIKNTLNLLLKAGIVYQCYHSSSQGHPLGAEKDHSKFKIFFFDIGLAQRILGLSIKDWFTQPLLPQHNGQMAEQFVAQELIAHSACTQPAELYYWHREAKSSNAEMDFVTVKDGQVVPIEVKASVKGHMKSMEVFLQSHKASSKGLKICAGFYQTLPKYEQIPFYGIEGWLKC